MRIYPPDHPFYGLTWRIVWAVYHEGRNARLIEERPSVHIDGQVNRVPDVTRAEIMRMARQIPDQFFLSIPNFGKRSLDILNTARGRPSHLSPIQKLKEAAEEIERLRAENIDWARGNLKRVMRDNEVALAVAAERERCAQVADSICGNAYPEVAAAIRGLKDE